MSGGRVRIEFDARGEVAEYELLPPRVSRRRDLSHGEELELCALCGLAWEGRETPAIREASDAILDWHDRRHIRAYERRLRSRAAALQVLRETNPQPKGGPRARLSR
jgi:hypothetical protein